MDLPAQISKYELLEFLGGGMSHVYRGRDTLIDRPVVVKILTLESCSDADAKARFLLEAKLAGNIQHENIVSVFDYGEHEGRPYIVMEFLKGKDLKYAIRNGTAGNYEERISIAIQIAEALQYVHSRGIVHRDIKPENIHIDPNGRVKLMDFGIAKTEDLSLTRTGFAMGTPYYMAPEQISGKKPTPMVDIYAYGMVLFELLTGIRGVQGDTMESVFFQVMTVPLNPEPMVQAGVPPSVRDLILRCTAKKAEDRPQNFQAVIDELRNPDASPTANTQTLTAAVPAPVAVQPEPARSRTPLLVGVLTGLILGVAALAVWLYLSRRPPPPVAGMIYIPKGTFLAGKDRTPTPLDGFYIDDTEVSNTDFAAFCAATGCKPPDGAAGVPVTEITIAQARAFAKWKGKRLPTALEWERAARGTKGDLFPWGNQLDPTLANVADNPSFKEHDLLPVNSFAPHPAYNMAGNAWEMVEGSVQPSAEAVKAFSQVKMDPPLAPSEKWIEVRGGSFNTPLAAALAYEWSPIPERYSARDIGFRCAKDAK